jgi:hypothetical protein
MEVEMMMEISKKRSRVESGKHDDTPKSSAVRVGTHHHHHDQQQQQQ